MIKHVKRLWNWLQESGANYRKETALNKAFANPEKWPFPVEVKKPRPQVKKATTRTKKPAVVAKAVAKKTVKKKAK